MEIVVLLVNKQIRSKVQVNVCQRCFKNYKERITVSRNTNEENVNNIRRLFSNAVN